MPIDPKKIKQIIDDFEIIEKWRYKVIMQRYNFAKNLFDNVIKI